MCPEGGCLLLTRTRAPYGAWVLGQSAAENPRAAFPKGGLKDARSSVSRMLTGVSAKGTWPPVFRSEQPCGRDALQCAGRCWLTRSLGLPGGRVCGISSFLAGPVSPGCWQRPAFSWGSL